MFSQGLVLRHRIKSFASPRVTARNSFHGEPSAADDAVFFHRFDCIGGACWDEAARRGSHR